MRSFLRPLFGMVLRLKHKTFNSISRFQTPITGNNSSIGSRLFLVNLPHYFFVDRIDSNPDAYLLAGILFEKLTLPLTSIGFYEK